MIPIARNKPIRLKLSAESLHLWGQCWAWGDSSASSSMARMIAHTSALSLKVDADSIGPRRGAGPLEPPKNRSSTVVVLGHHGSS
jgi:hypothetical protein